MNVTTVAPSLTAADRCDASQSEQATRMYVKPGHHSLMFCEHHARKFEDALTTDGWYLATEPTNII